MKQQRDEPNSSIHCSDQNLFTISNNGISISGPGLEAGENYIAEFSFMFQGRIHMVSGNFIYPGNQGEIHVADPIVTKVKDRYEIHYTPSSSNNRQVFIYWIAMNLTLLKLLLNWEKME